MPVCHDAQVVVQDQAGHVPAQIAFFEFHVLPHGLLVCPGSQNSISDWGTSSLFCNTGTDKFVSLFRRCLFKAGMLAARIRAMQPGAGLTELAACLSSDMTLRILSSYLFDSPDGLVVGARQEEAPILRRCEAEHRCAMALYLLQKLTCPQTPHCEAVVGVSGRASQHQALFWA